jgi:hypothetical protein
LCDFPAKFSVHPDDYRPGHRKADQGWLRIPGEHRNKDAAWEFISWAVSKKTIERIVKEKGYGAVCRRSVITSDYFNKSLTLNGDSVAPLFLQVLELGSKIQSQVQSEVGKNQREYFLREQMKAIQKELGEGDEQARESDELRAKILEFTDVGSERIPALFNCHPQILLDLGQPRQHTDL